MKIIFSTLVLITFLTNESKSQNKYTPPKGYTVYKDYDNKPFRLDNDFDGDGIHDLVMVYAKNNSENENIVAVYLSTSFGIKKTYAYFPFGSRAYNLEFKNKVLTIGSCLGTGRYCKTLKFKFYSALKTMRLIGYDEESFGNAAHEGAYLKSINLLTNKYELSGPKWKSKIIKESGFPSLTLENLDEKKLEYLENVGSTYLTD